MYDGSTGAGRAPKPPLPKGDRRECLVLRCPAGAEGFAGKCYVFAEPKANSILSTANPPVTAQRRRQIPFGKGALERSHVGTRNDHLQSLIRKQDIRRSPGSGGCCGYLDAFFLGCFFLYAISRSTAARSTAPAMAAARGQASGSVRTRATASSSASMGKAT